MEAIAAIIAITSGVWGVVLWFRGGLVAGAVAVLIAASVFSYPFFHLETQPVPLTVDRLLWVALLIQYIVWRRMRWADPKPPAAADVLFGLFLGVLAVSTFTHDWRDQGFRPLAWLVFYFVMPAGVYWIVRQSRLREQSVRGTFGVLAVLGLYLAITAIAEVEKISWLVFPRYIVSSQYPEFFGRARGPFLNPVACGFFQTAALCAGLMFWPHSSRVGKLAWFGFALLLCAGTFCTLTRSTWMGMGAAIFVLGGLALPRRWKLPLLGGLALVAALLVAANWPRIVAFRRDRGMTASETASSVRLRPILARVAWNMVRDRPLFGCGFAQYEKQCVNYLTDWNTQLPLRTARPFRQHNALLALATETGLVGGGLFLALLVLWTRNAWRLWQNRDAPLWARQQGLFFLAVAGSYLPNAMFHEVSIIPAFNLLFFFAAGMTAGVQRQHGPAGAAYCQWPQIAAPVRSCRGETAH